MKKIEVNGKLYIIKPCPCCGHQPIEDIDYLHPTYNGFEIYKEFESEENFNFYDKNPNKYNQIFELNCLETEGGCGCEIVADTLDNVINKWNNPICGAEGEKEIHDCHFCGKEMDDKNIRPTGIFWKYDEEEDFCIYVSKNEKNSNQCIKIECYEYLGGCGAKMTENDRKTLIRKWNKKSSD